MRRVQGRTTRDDTTKCGQAGPRERGNGKVCSVKEQKQVAGGIWGSPGARAAELDVTQSDSTCRNPAVATPGSPHCCQHLLVTNPDPRLNHHYSNPFPSILLLFNLFFGIKGWRRSLIYRGTLKAAPSEHPEPGLWCRCAKAQQEIIWSFSCTSARENCTDFWEKAK